MQQRRDKIVDGKKSGAKLVEQQRRREFQKNRINKLKVEKTIGFVLPEKEALIDQDKKNQRMKKLRKATYFLNYALEKEKSSKVDPRIRYLRV